MLSLSPPSDRSLTTTSPPPSGSNKRRSLSPRRGGKKVVDKTQAAKLLTFFKSMESIWKQYLESINCTEVLPINWYLQLLFFSFLFFSFLFSIFNFLIFEGKSFSIF